MVVVVSPCAIESEKFVKSNRLKDIAPCTILLCLANTTLREAIFEGMIWSPNVMNLYFDSF